MRMNVSNDQARYKQVNKIILTKYFIKLIEYEHESELNIKFKVRFKVRFLRKVKVGERRPLY